MFFRMSVFFCIYSAASIFHNIVFSLFHTALVWYFTAVIVSLYESIKNAKGRNLSNNDQGREVGRV